MASPTKIMPAIKQISPRLLLRPPKFRNTTTLNIDTPNRSRIMKLGLNDKNLQIVGVGGFGTVYRASYKGVNVAAKILKHNIYKDEIIAAEMHRTNIKHQNIVHLIRCDKGEAVSIITMELCGPSLDELIEERCLLKEERIMILLNITQALKYCHDSNIIHADVKPKNIFITNHNRAKLGDFGSSIMYDNTKKEKIPFKGTAGYEAPEVVQGKFPTSTSDTYSLGVVAWQMLSREKPFAGYHCHVIIYLTGKGYKPEKNVFLDDEYNGQYKHLYRQMWNTNDKERPPIIDIYKKLKKLV